LLFCCRGHSASEVWWRVVSLNDQIIADSSGMSRIFLKILENYYKSGNIITAHLFKN